MAIIKEKNNPVQTDECDLKHPVQFFSPQNRILV